MTTNDRLPNPSRIISQQLDPIERWVPFLFKIVVYLLLLFILFQAAEAFAEYVPGMHWPFLLSVIRTWTFLPIHEAGHFLFLPFSDTVTLLGGSLLQILLPFLWFIVAAHQRSHIAPFPLFWTGENLMDVSLYIRDAPLRWLPLLGGHTSRHDWYNILSRWNALDAAGTIADVVYGTGIAIAVGAIIGGILLAALSFRKRYAPVTSTE